VEGTFLQRWEKDLADRNNRVATEKNDPECRFQPEGNRNSQKIMATKGGGKFMARMTEDLQNRVDKFKSREATLAKPPKGFKSKKAAKKK